MRPWCNYSAHRTVSARRVAGRKSNKPVHGRSRRAWSRHATEWWRQAR